MRDEPLPLEGFPQPSALASAGAFSYCLLVSGEIFISGGFPVEDVFSMQHIVI